MEPSFFLLIFIPCAFLPLILDGFFSPDDLSEMGIAHELSSLTTLSTWIAKTPLSAGECLFLRIYDVERKEYKQ
jgi:hypothetical protein